MNKKKEMIIYEIYPKDLKEDAQKELSDIYGFKDIEDFKKSNMYNRVLFDKAIQKNVGVIVESQIKEEEEEQKRLEEEEQKRLEEEEQKRLEEEEQKRLEEENPQYEYDDEQEYDNYDDDDDDDYVA